MSCLAPTIDAAAPRVETAIEPVTCRLSRRLIVIDFAAALKTDE